MNRTVALPLAMVLAATVAAREPWADQVVEGARAFAHMRTPAGAGAYCRAVDLAPFGVDDPRMAILMYNRAFGAVCCGPIPDVCAGVQDLAERDLRQAADLVRHHGATRDPEFAVILWHEAMMDLRRSPSYLPGPPEGECAGCPRAQQVADLLEAVAPAFAAEPPPRPDDPDLGLRRGPPTTPGSWLAAGGDGARLWPRAMLYSDFQFAPLLGRRIFPALALERLANQIRGHRQYDLAWDLHTRASQLRDRLVGREHPVAMAGWLDMAAAWTVLRPESAVEILTDLAPRWQTALGRADHPDMIPLLLRQETALRMAKRRARAAEVVEALSRAAAAPHPARPSAMRRHLARTNRNHLGYRFGDVARTKARERVAKRRAPSGR